MVKAILHGGSIELISPMPSTWGEGQELIIQVAPALEDRADLASWAREVEELATQIPNEDFDRLDEVLTRADREAKELVRRQMGLS